MTSLIRRKDIRLQGFDYAGSAFYHVTICVEGRRWVFGQIVDEQGKEDFDLQEVDGRVFGQYHVQFSPEGEKCREILLASRSNEHQIRVGDFMIMPDHVHFIAIADQRNGRATSLGSFVHYLKSAISKAFHEGNPGVVLWQKGYYEHVIRDEADYERILEYIANNPTRWVLRKCEQGAQCAPLRE